MPISFFELDTKARLKNKNHLKVFLKNLVHRHLFIKRADLNYIFCTDDYLLEKNKQFLNHNTLTDIITFDLSENDSNLVGEIYISIDRIKENAEKFSVAYQTELHRVIFHGALHLCGFKDKKKEDKALMTEMENQCLQQYFAV